MVTKEQPPVKQQLSVREQLLALGAEERFIIDRETHPSFFESSVPLTENDTALLGPRGTYHLVHLKPMSIFVCAIGNMWVEGGHHRVVDMVKAMDNKGYTIAYEEIHDGCVMPGDHIGQMRTEATYMALDSGAEWLFMVENDVLLELDTLERLLSSDLPVVVPYINDLEQRWPGTTLSGPYYPPHSGVHPVLWSVMSVMLFNTKVFNAIGPNVWGDHFGINEYQLAQRLNHVGHRMYLDSDTVVDVARSPSRHRSLTWDELQAGTRATFERSRYEERDRRPPEGLDPAFSNGVITQSGAYEPLGGSFRQRANIMKPVAPIMQPVVPSGPNRAERRRQERERRSDNGLH